jgi:hypothetical protein
MSRLSLLIGDKPDITDEGVYVPLWGVTINIRSMDGNGRAAYLQRLVKAREEEDDEAIGQIECEILVQCAYDPEDGTQAFSDADIPMLMSKHGGVIGMLARKAVIASGLDNDAEERLGKPSSASPTPAAEAVAETDPTPSDVSTSPSPESLA